ncbi:2-dehydropantoate 2-reductase [Halogeometricum borinquense]|uniref:2-dehydropantoate 2-reductase n=1 Tax=Halogeometricum borinquense TaxID=60847 RepID=A0A6C0UC52_9EURY|nr:2-dehydropantoate 2-reductase [Halogeometricum borinquense]QIB72842.1 2-dehydropantoate 2-reductase [Halogeometricum borinquense]QIQ75203.1 2-dehydropantoate 2-reductase [Halogeometricum borinquense]
MDVLVFGAGSLGTLVGALLARVHDVTLVGRDPHVSHVRERGVTVSGAIEAQTTPDATTESDGHRADLAVVTVKSFDTPAAAAALSTGAFDAVLSLQNGLPEDELAARLDAPVLAGTATYGARLHEPGHVECTGIGRVVLGARDGGTDPRAERVGKAFRDAGIETLVASDMPRRLWEKLAVNAGINAVTALARVENGALADDPGRELAHRAARETARVARAEGVSLSNRRAERALDEVVEATSANRSSMLQDVDDERRTEVEAIHGVVVARAEAHRLSVPTNRTLADLLRTWEAGRGVRE